jgi:hypothetical protein
METRGFPSPPRDGFGLCYKNEFDVLSVSNGLQTRYRLSKKLFEPLFKRDCAAKDAG